MSERLCNEKVRKEEIIKQIQDWVTKYGKTPTVTEWSKSKKEGENIVGATTIKNNFGTWSEALIEADVKPNASSKQSKEEVLEQLIEWKKVYGAKAPTIEEWDKEREKGLKLCGRFLCTSLLVRERLESWNVALEKAGFEDVRLKKKIEKEDIKKEVGHWMEINKRKPSSTLWRKLKEEGKVETSTTTIQTAFGSWNNFMLELLQDEEKIRTRTVVSREDKIKGLLLWKEKYKTVPTMTEWDRLRHTLGIPTASGMAYIKEFDSWNDPLRNIFGKKAVNNKDRYSDEFMLSELREWVVKNKRKPLRDEWTGLRVKGLVKSGATVMCNRFGSWREAIEKALEQNQNH